MLKYLVMASLIILPFKSFAAPVLTPTNFSLYATGEDGPEGGLFVLSLSNMQTPNYGLLRYDGFKIDSVSGFFGGTISLDLSNCPVTLGFNYTCMPIARLTPSTQTGSAVVLAEADYTLLGNVGYADLHYAIPLTINAFVGRDIPEPQSLAIILSSLIGLAAFARISVARTRAEV